VACRLETGDGQLFIDVDFGLKDVVVYFAGG
jgi:hypothetical protein